MTIAEQTTTDTEWVDLGWAGTNVATLAIVNPLFASGLARYWDGYIAQLTPGTHGPAFREIDVETEWERKSGPAEHRGPFRDRESALMFHTPDNGCFQIQGRFADVHGDGGLVLVELRIVLYDEETIEDYAAEAASALEADSVLWDDEEHVEIPSGVTLPTISKNEWMSRYVEVLAKASLEVCDNPDTLTLADVRRAPAPPYRQLGHATLADLDAEHALVSRRADLVQKWADKCLDDVEFIEDRNRILRACAAKAGSDELDVVLRWMFDNLEVAYGLMGVADAE